MSITNRLTREAYRTLKLNTLLQIRDDLRKVLAELRGLGVVLTARDRVRRAKGSRRG